jgi:flavin reductase (DIM6/NTAB) family NADH-FMN oxidoreductase RutF
MSIYARAFRHTVGQFVTGVTVMAADVDGTISVMTANAFTSLSLDPPLVLFCFGMQTRMGQIVDSAARFSVNPLQSIPGQIVEADCNSFSVGTRGVRSFVGGRSS